MRKLLNGKILRNIYSDSDSGSGFTKKLTFSLIIQHLHGDVAFLYCCFCWYIVLCVAASRCALFVVQSSWKSMCKNYVFACFGWCFFRFSFFFSKFNQRSNEVAIFYCLHFALWQRSRPIRAVATKIGAKNQISKYFGTPALRHTHSLCFFFALEIRYERI